MQGVSGGYSWPQRWQLHFTDMWLPECGESHQTRQTPHKPLLAAGKPQQAADQMHRAAGRSPVPGTKARPVCPLSKSAVGCSAEVYATSATWDIFLGISGYYLQVLPPWTLPPGWLGLALSQMKGAGLLQHPLPCWAGLHSFCFRQDPVEEM